MSSFGEWHYTCDRDATVAAYSRVSMGYTAACTCNGCRNFVAARSKAFPPSFMDLLDSLGIDPTKDAEIYHTARMSPGKHLYGGWFHFVGSLEVTGDFAPVEMGDGFSVWMCRSASQCLDGLKGLPLVQVELSATAVPWCLDEEEAE
jgi:hypothetical protein